MGSDIGARGVPTPTTGKSERHGAATQGPRRLVRFKIVGPLLIQADIIGGVCYLHTLVRSAPRTRSYNEEEHGKPLRVILGVDRRCYRRPTACSPTCPLILRFAFALLFLFLSRHVFFYPIPIFPPSIYFPPFLTLS